MTYSFDEYVEMALEQLPMYVATMARPMMAMLTDEQKNDLERQLNTAMDAVHRGDREALDTVLANYPMLTSIAATAGIDFESVISSWLERASSNT